MAITFVQHASGGYISSSSQTTGIGSSVATGNNIIVCVATTQATGNTVVTVASVTDNKGNLYSKAISASNTGPPIPVGAEIWYAENVTGGSVTVTTNLSAISTDTTVDIEEWSGLTTGSLDQTISSYTSSGTSLSTGTSGATTTASELVIAYFGSDWISVSGTASAGSGYSNLFNTFGGYSSFSVIESKVVSATGAQSASVSLTKSALSMGVLATFKGGSSPVVSPGNAPALFFSNN